VTIPTGNAVAVIDLLSNSVVGGPIRVGVAPVSIAITRDGTRAYVSNAGDGTVSVIDLATDRAIGAPIVVGGRPGDLAITPNGARLYVLTGRDSISVIALATNELLGPPIAVGRDPYRVAITPDGARAYITNHGAGGDGERGTVAVIDLAKNVLIGSPIVVGEGPWDVAITPDGARAYVTNVDDGTVSVIDVATNQVVGDPIRLGSQSSAADRRITAAGRIASIEAAVAGLRELGSLKRGQADALTKSLERVRKVAAEPCPECGDRPRWPNNDLINRLWAFQYDVHQLIRKRELSSTQGQPLIDAASVAVAELSR
jgi:YVTN family beta-propeller protein